MSNNVLLHVRYASAEKLIFKKYKLHNV